MIVRTCLEKDPADRWQSAHDLVLQLKWIVSAGSHPGVPAPVAVRRRSWPRFLWIALAALFVTSLAVSALHLREKPAGLSVMRFQIPLPPKMAWVPNDIPAISPDGTKLVFAATADGKSGLWLRSLDALALQPLAGTEHGFGAFWSPDSLSIGFWADGKLKRSDLTAAPPQIICELRGVPVGATWSPEGTIVFGLFYGPVKKVAGGGGEPKPVLSLDASRRELGQYWPWLLPDGRHFLYYSVSSEPSMSGVRLGALDSADTRSLLGSGSSASFVPPALLLFGRQNTLMAQSFDPGTLKLEGDAFPISEVGSTPLPASYYSASRSGVLVWRGADSSDIQLAAYSREGRRLRTFGEPRAVRQVSLSPDERRLALEIMDYKSATPNLDIWLLDLATSIYSRVTYTPAADMDAVWSPDGREIVFTSNRTGHYNLYRKVVGGPPEELLLESAEPKFATQWRSDGSVLYVNGNGSTFFRLPLTGGKKPETLFQSEFYKDSPAVSSDGHWVAYHSVESGRPEVYLAAYPGFNNRRQISNSGGCQALWRKDGKELFYLTLEGQIMAVDIKPGAAAEAGIPREVFRVPLRVHPNVHQYAVTADGRKFIVMENTENAAVPLTVVLNWNAHLKR